MGCSSTLAFVLVLALRATIKGYDAESIKMMATSGADSGNWEKYLNSTPESEGKADHEPSNSPTWKESSFEIDVLLEENRSTSTNSVGGSGMRSPGDGPPCETYPYPSDEVIGGDSVSSIERRLLERKPQPSSEELYEAHIQAEDLFEVKVDIIRLMTPLDPEGDWMRRGARALDNPRTATGEESLERLHSILEELNSQGKQSQAFHDLKNKVFRKWDDADRSSAS